VSASRDDALSAVTTLLKWIGLDPSDPAVVETPRRVVDAMREMTSGMYQDPAKILSTSFDGAGYDAMVVLRGVEFVSMCEHHLLPFTGKADVAYIPRGRVVGISKLARLVECYARRPQLQERMTVEIANALQEHLKPVGVGVVLRAEHSCMSCRGVRKRAEWVTSCLLGAMRDKPEARAELFGLVRP